MGPAGHTGDADPDLVNRNFTAAAPNLKPRSGRKLRAHDGPGCDSRMQRRSRTRWRLVG